MRWLLLLAFFFPAFLPPTPVAASEPADWRLSAQTALHLLDYLGVDYPGAVRDGAVLDAGEYAEQREFAGQVASLVQGLPERPERARLLAQAEALSELVRDKGSAQGVAAATTDLRRELVAAYSLVVTPARPPDLARGRELYGERCASCHGPEGWGDGPAAPGLEPPPANFGDAARMAQRSVYGLYNSITLGVGGTAMASFAELSEDDRWALAFFVSQLGLTPQQLARGEAAWQSGRHTATFENLENLATLSSDEVAARFGPDAAAAQRWLRAHPEALAASAASPLQVTVKTLRESLEAQHRGDPAAARRLALAAYLEGFEPLEPRLDAVDAALRGRIEREMMAYRSQLASGAPAHDLEARVNGIVGLLGTAEHELQEGTLGAGALFVSSLLILVREGLEAILVLAAIVAFLVKSGRRDALPWVHLGWIVALAAGGATWLVATYVTSISGASREMTEAVSALCAAGVLLYVGVWLHSKAHAQAWQRFVHQQVGDALGGRTLGALASVSFLAVYREMFEVVLFYQALWAEAGAAGGRPLLAGVGAAVAVLVFVAWAVFRYGIRLPLARFFSVTSVVLAVLAVAFVGQGVSALQEAGAISVDVVSFIRVPALGIFPTAQTLLAQLASAAVIAGSFAWASRQRAPRVERVDGR
jgi:high-affinity iron transporter